MITAAPVGTADRPSTVGGSNALAIKPWLS